MAETSETVKLSLRLLIDEERNKVVLAESGKDFVDVLFSLLTLPMGSIVRLLEKHRKSPLVAVGCFNNLYKSVSEMGLESFQTEPVSKYYYFHYRERCREFYSISNTEQCECGEFVNSYFVRGLMNHEILGLEEEQAKGRILRNDNNGGFFRCKTSSFIVTDNLNVASSSMDYVLSTLRGLGYGNAYKLGEILLDIGFSEVLTLLECLFTSDSPLTDTFLRKQSSLHMTKSRIPLSPTMQESEALPNQTITLKAFVRKLDSKILCIECGADFIDLLFTFLALPLEYVWEISGANMNLGCIGNLFRSFKSLNEGTEDASSSSKCLLPSYYNCPKQLLDVVTEQEEIYYSFNRCSDDETYDSKFTRQMPDCLNPQRENKPNMYPTHKTADARVLYMTNFGFAREYTRFLVTDDFVIKQKDSVSNISLLKLQMHLENENVEEQVITIGKPEAISLLRASMMTSSALTTCLWNLIAKKLKEET